jgi:hypothetical protein
MKPKFENFYKNYKNEIIGKILDGATDLINEQINKFEVEFRKKFEQEPSDYDVYSKKIQLTFDLVKSLEKYTKKGDELLTMNVSTGNKGNFEIKAKIKRDSEVYDFFTEVIYAGGFNIQRLHYRYITKTNLPKTDNDGLTKELTVRIKNISKDEKILKEIGHLKFTIEKVKKVPMYNGESDLELISKYGDDEAKDGVFRLINLDWNEIKRRGADKNYENEQDFLNSKDEYIKSVVKFIHTIHLTTPEKLDKSIKHYEKKIEALKSKLSY